MHVLNSKIIDKLRKIKNVELIIGIPSYNCAHTINYVIYQSAIGLKEFFPDYKSLILISDGGSIDGTQKVAQAIKIPENIKKEVIEYIGVSGKGNAIKAIFEVSKLLNSKAIAMIDSDLRSINPYWIKLLIEPILKGVDLVTPFYIRHKYDATITNHVCYPFTQAIYGKRIRQPIGGDFGLSIKLIKKLLESDLWNNPYTPKFGIDIFITHSAIYGGFKIKQAFLGSKVHEVKDPGKHLASMFKQVVGSMFFCMLNYEAFWKKVKKSHEVPLIKHKIPFMYPEPIVINVKNLVKDFKNELKANYSLLKTLLSKDSINVLNELKKANERNFRLSNETWAKIFYELSACFKKESLKSRRESILDALKTVWIGKIIDFAILTKTMDEEEAEKEVIKEAKTFEKLKTYFLKIYG